MKIRRGCAAGAGAEQRVRVGARVATRCCRSTRAQLRRRAAGCRRARRTLRSRARRRVAALQQALPGDIFSPPPTALRCTFPLTF